jgi:acetolactate synthase-1/2/3 large subunit
MTDARTEAGTAAETDPPATLARAVAETLASCGVTRMFGVPGGGSSLDLIDAGAACGIEFVLCRTETAAAIMASVTGEITGVPGVVLTGIGPGAASVVNGVAYASLERAPLVVFTDTHEAGAVAPPHQIFDQRALFRPISKAQVRLSPEGGVREISRLLDLAVTWPRGPVHVDLSAGDAGARIPATKSSPETPAVPPRAGPLPEDIARAAAMIRAAKRPAVIAGLEVRDDAASSAVRALVAKLRAPAMATYKAKGAINDRDPLTMGMFTSAKSDSVLLAAADLVILAGVDPVEMIPGPWRTDAGTVVLARSPGLAYPFRPDAEVVGPVEVSAAALADGAVRAGWHPDEVARIRDAIRGAGRVAAKGRTADEVVEAVQAAAPAGVRCAVDAGAHMFSAMGCWRADAPHGVLKSSGLSTMGFALPAALAAWLVEPGRRTVALTGDGGMMMCLGELSTASRLGAKTTVVVLNDAALSLIDIKQQRQQRPPLGVRTPRADFAAAARGMGCAAWTVGETDSLEDALKAAFAVDGPALVDVAVDPGGYRDQLAGLRG